MNIGFVGLGKMGYNMVCNILEHQHKVVAYDVNKNAVRKVSKAGAIPAGSLQSLVEKLPKHKIIWIMVPHQFVDSVITDIMPLLSKGDIIIDGGNSHYSDSIRRFATLKKIGVSFLDVGTSGGVVGARTGACMMIGGDKKTYLVIEKLFKDMNVKGGYFYCGKSGAGHYVKMVHNAIEYGIMESYAEGFELLFRSCDFTGLNLKGVADVWNHGSIIESYLLSKIVGALHKDPKLKKISGEVADSGEGRWTAHAAIDCGVDIPVLAQALFTRFSSREKNPFSNRLLAAMRHEFGGHAVKKARR